MGTWGVALYANDTASDVRDMWLEKLQQGASGDVATAELLKEWGDDDDPLFWIALADTQWTWGRLETNVRERAQAALAAGGDLKLWEGHAERAARARVFKKLATRLETPAPPPKAVRVVGDAVAWKRGQLWAYATLDGKNAIFRVTAVDPNVGLVPSPMVELLDVVFDKDPPSDDVLRSASLRLARESYISEKRFDFYAPEHRASPIFMPKVKNRGDLPRHRLRRLRALGEPRPADPATTKVVGSGWGALDQFLSNMFDRGGPRLGAVHAWPLADGGSAFTVVEFGNWTARDIEPGWYLGVLDCRGAGVDESAIEKANVLCSIIVHGFAPAATLREVGYRPPKNFVVENLSGAVHRWENLPKLLANPDRLVAADKGMKTWIASVKPK